MTFAAVPHALLFIGGVDGRFNSYSQAVFKYLFLGTTGDDMRRALTFNPVVMGG